MIPIRAMITTYNATNERTMMNSVPKAFLSSATLLRFLAPYLKNTSNEMARTPSQVTKYAENVTSLNKLRISVIATINTPKIRDADRKVSLNEDLAVLVYKT